MTKPIFPRPFWALFGVAWAVFAVMAIANQTTLLVAAAPGGILDHQAAGSAERVAAIHHAWRAEGAWLAAQALVGFDFLFIALAAAAAIWGGFALARAGLRALGAAAILGGAMALAADATETAAQALQIWGAGPSDQLAGLAKACIEPKLAAYVTANGALLAGIALSRLKT